jgi:hypothetical protein
MIDFDEVEVINIENLNEYEIKNLITSYESVEHQNKLFLFLPFEAEAFLKEIENKFTLLLKTKIDKKEDMEYFLENIININNNYPDLTIEIDNYKILTDLNIPQEVIVKE